MFFFVNKVAHIDQTLKFLEMTTKPGAHKTDETRQIFKYAINVVKPIRKVSETDPPLHAMYVLKRCARFSFSLPKTALPAAIHMVHTEPTN